MAQPKFDKREQISITIAGIVIGFIMLVTLYITTIDKDTIKKLIVQNSSSSSIISSSVRSNNSEIESLISACTNEDNINNFVPDQYYIDKYRDNSTKIEVMSQALTDISSKININSAKIEKDRDTKYNPDNFSQFKNYQESISTNSGVEIYNRSRLELADLMENKIPSAKNISFKDFVFKYYCGQLKAYRILSSSNRYSYPSTYLDFKENQLRDLQSLSGEEFEKRVYTQAMNNFGPEINYSKMYQQYKSIANLY